MPGPGTPQTGSTLERGGPGTLPGTDDRTGGSGADAPATGVPKLHAPATHVAASSPVARSAPGRRGKRRFSDIEG